MVGRGIRNLVALDPSMTQSGKKQRQGWLSRSNAAAPLGGLLGLSVGLKLCSVAGVSDSRAFGSLSKPTGLLARRIGFSAIVLRWIGELFLLSKESVGLSRSILTSCRTLDALRRFSAGQPGILFCPSSRVVSMDRQSREMKSRGSTLMKDSSLALRLPLIRHTSPSAWIDTRRTETPKLLFVNMELYGLRLAIGQPGMDQLQQHQLARADTDPLGQLRRPN